MLALPLYWFLSAHLNSSGVLTAIAVVCAAGVWICDRTGRDLGVADHKSIVWDEVAAFLFVLFLTPPTPLWQICAFALFRFFDIVKPGPVGYLEKRFHGGLGVMIDDLAAAFLTLVSLSVVKLLAAAVGERFGFGPV